MDSLISVIVPAFNAEKTLCRCIDSILTQSYANIELILVDDGSTDGTSDICDSYQSKDNRVKVIHKENAGVSCARNEALKLVSGDWIAFSDADDMYLPNAFESMINASVVYPQTDIILGDSEIKDVNGQKKIKWGFKQIIFKEIHHLPKFIEIWGNLFRTSIIKENGIYFNENLSYSEDRLFFYEMTIRSHYLIELPCIVYSYIISSNSAMKIRNGFRKASNSFVAARLIKSLGENCQNENLINDLNIAEERTIKRGINYMVSQKDRPYKDFENEYRQYYSNIFYFRMMYVFKSVKFNISKFIRSIIK